MQKLTRQEQLKKLSDLCLSNLKSLTGAIDWVITNKVGAFRVLSPLFPRITHPDVAYCIEELPDVDSIHRHCEHIRNMKQNGDIRLSLHPDQFNVLSSPHEDVVRNTITELEYQGLLAENVGANVINIHAGGV